MRGVCAGGGRADSAGAAAGPIDVGDHMGLAWKVANAVGRGRGSAMRAAGLEVEDLAQAVALKMVAAARSFDPSRAKWSTYALAFAAHVAHAMVSRARPMFQVPACEGGRDAAEAEDPDAGRDLGRAAARDEVGALLAPLPARERRAVELVFGLGGAAPLSFRAAAGEMGESRATLNLLVRRAIRRMRGDLP